MRKMSKIGFIEPLQVFMNRHYFTLFQILFTDKSQMFIHIVEKVRYNWCTEFESMTGTSFGVMRAPRRK